MIVHEPSNLPNFAETEDIVLISGQDTGNTGM